MKRRSFIEEGEEEDWERRERSCEEEGESS